LTATGVAGEQVDRVRRRLGGVERGDKHGARSARAQNFHRGERRRERRTPLPAQTLQLELVGRDNVGRRQRALAQELGNAGAHVFARAYVADHRVAAVARVRVRGLGERDRLEDGSADVGRAEVAGEHAVAAPKRAALGNPAHHLADVRGVEHAAAPLAVAEMVGKLHGVHGPHLAAEALEREHGGRIAHVAVGDMGLDGEEVHIGPSYVGGARCHK
jgi:hypothetical protein